MPACAKLAVVVALFAVAAPWGEAAAQAEEPVDVNLIGVDPGVPPIAVTVPGGVDVNNLVEVTAPDGIEVSAPDGIDVAVTSVVVPVQDEWQRPYQRTQTVTVLSGLSGGEADFSPPAGFYLVVTHLWAHAAVPNGQGAPLVQVFGAFSGSSFIHTIRTTAITDAQPALTSYAGAQPVTLYADELTISVFRTMGITGPANMTATVTGYLLPVGGTNPRQ